MNAQINQSFHTAYVGITLVEKKKIGIYLNEELAIAHNCIGVEKRFALASLF